MQTHKSWMRKETKSEYDKTKPCKPISHEWEKKRRVNMTKKNETMQTHKSWIRVNMTKLNHANPISRREWQKNHANP